MPNKIEWWVRPATWLAIAGLVASLFVHVLALRDVSSPFGSLTWALHIGVFVVGGAALLVVQDITTAKRADFWKAVLRGCPGWGRAGCYALSAYAMLNFVLSIVKATPYPNDCVPDVITLRAFSGHWMAFYSASAAILYSAIRRCNNGSAALSSRP